MPYKARYHNYVLNPYLEVGLCVTTKVYKMQIDHHTASMALAFMLLSVFSEIISCHIPDCIYSLS